MEGRVLSYVVLAGVALWIVRRRPGVALSRGEGLALGAFASLGLLQGTLEGQVQFDDYVFAPLYLAIPVWLGRYRGAAEGFTATLLGLAALYLVASFHPLGSPGGAGGDATLLHEWLMALVVVGVMAAAAGLLGEKWWAAAWLPVLWIAAVATVDAEALASLSPWITVMIAVTVATVGVVLVDTGLLPAVPTRTPAQGAAGDADQ